MKREIKPDNEQLRTEISQNHEIFCTMSGELFDRITQLASLICDMPIVVISSRDNSQQWSNGGIYPPLDFSTVDFSICLSDDVKTELIEIKDTTTDGRFKDNPLIIGNSAISYYAAQRILDSDGNCLGTLYVLDYKPGALLPNQKKALKVLAEEIEVFVKERREIVEMQSFSNLFDLSNDLVFIMDRKGNFKKVNPAFENALGRTQKTLLTTSFFDLVHPDDVEKSHNYINRLDKGFKTINLTHRIKINNDSYTTLKWAVTPEPLTGNLLAVAQDISTKESKDLELMHSEERARIFFENSQGFMCTHDLSGNFTSVNEAGAAILGYTKSEILKFSLFDIVPETRHELIKAYLLEIKTTGQSKGQMITTHIDGSYRIWLYNNILEQSPTGENYVIGNAIDITERNKLEEDLKKTKETLEQTNRVARVGGWEMDVLKQRLYWTFVTKEIHGMPADYKPILDEAIFFYKEGYSRDLIATTLHNALETGESWDLELEIIDSHGNEKWVRSLGDVEMQNGICKRMYGAIQDITQTINQRNELKAAIGKAENASMAKSEFLANMSHEIRTPLNGVIGFTDLVLKTQLNETQQQYLSIVNQSANALLSIISDILDFSKIEAGKLELDYEKCDIYEIAGQAADIITYQVQNKGLEMLLNVSPELPRFIYADTIRLKQILVNLLGNAAKFTIQGEVELKITPIAKNNDETTIRFAIRDTGIGIQPDKQLKIFEAFSQEDNSTTKKYGGTGLGLTISNKLLALMDSKLELKSVPDVGSTFFFDVTFKSEQGDAIEWYDTEAIKNALVVDDNQNNRMILVQMLLLKNIKATEAKNGLEALQLLATGEKYDVILMDYHMPFMDGLETVKKIRESFSDAAHKQPVILLHSSSDDEKIHEACRELNITQRLVKPIKINDFYHVLSRLHHENIIASQQPQIQPAFTRNLTVLIAEDNPVNMMLIRTIVKKIVPSVELIEVPNGLEAVKYCQTATPDLILMDIQMPEMNGYEATKAIRDITGNESVPIVAITAGNVKGEKEKCAEAGMNDFLVKPIREENIVAVFNTWTDSAISS